MKTRQWLSREEKVDREAAPEKERVNVELSRHLDILGAIAAVEPTLFSHPDLV